MAKKKPAKKKKPSTSKKPKTVGEIITKAREQGIGSLTPAELMQLRRVKRMQQEDAPKNTWGGARPGAGHPTLREIRASQTGMADSIDSSEKDTIYGLTADEAEERVCAQLSPSHLDLFLVKHLMRNVSEGGKAGSDAARMLREMQKERSPAVKKTVSVKLQIG